MATYMTTQPRRFGRQLPSEWLDALPEPIAEYYHAMGLTLDAAKRERMTYLHRIGKPNYDVEYFKAKSATPKTQVQQSSAAPKAPEPAKPSAAPKPPSPKPAHAPKPQPSNALKIAPHIARLSQAEAAAAGEQFLRAFGEQGAMWFLQGRSFAECTRLFAESKMSRLRSGLKDLFSKKFGSRERNFVAKTAAVDRTEAEPVAEPSSDKKTDYKYRNGCRSDSLAKFASGIKMPPKKGK